MGEPMRLRDVLDELAEEWRREEGRSADQEHQT